MRGATHLPRACGGGGESSSRRGSWSVCIAQSIELRLRPLRHALDACHLPRPPKADHGEGQDGGRVPRLALLGAVGIGCAQRVKTSLRRRRRVRAPGRGLQGLVIPFSSPAPAEEVPSLRGGGGLGTLPQSNTFGLLEDPSVTPKTACHLPRPPEADRGEGEERRMKKPTRWRGLWGCSVGDIESALGDGGVGHIVGADIVGGGAEEAVVAQLLDHMPAPAGDA